jgi:hypothetical protein
LPLSLNKQQTKQTGTNHEQSNPTQKRETSMKMRMNNRLARVAIALLASTWAVVASAADQKAEDAPSAPVPLRWQPDLAKPVNFVDKSYQGADKKTDLASITSSMKLAWEKISQDMQPLTAFEIYTFDRSKLEEDFARNLEACQSLGCRITLEVNRDKPNPSGNCSVEWLDTMFKKYPSFVGVNYGVGANGKPGVSTADMLKLERVKSLIEVCGKNGAYFILNLWNEGQTTKGVLEKMLADPELVAVMKQYHRNIVFFNTSAIRTQVSPEEYVQNTQTLEKMLADGLIGRMGNYDWGNSYDEAWKARKADGYRAFYARNKDAALWEFLRTFDAK